MSAISAFILFIILNINNLFNFNNFVILENPIINIQTISEENTDKDDKEIDWLSEDETKTKSTKIPKNNMLPFFIIFFILFISIIGGLIFILIKAKKWADNKNSKFLFKNLQTCPECNHKASEKAKYCEMCGSPLTIIEEKEKTDENK